MVVFVRTLLISLHEYVSYLTPVARAAVKGAIELDVSVFQKLALKVCIVFSFGSVRMKDSGDEVDVRCGEVVLPHGGELRGSLGSFAFFLSHRDLVLWHSVISRCCVRSLGRRIGEFDLRLSDLFGLLQLMYQLCNLSVALIAFFIDTNAVLAAIALACPSSFG